MFSKKPWMCVFQRFPFSEACASSPDHDSRATPPRARARRGVDRARDLSRREIRARAVGWTHGNVRGGGGGARARFVDAERVASVREGGVFITTTSVEHLNATTEATTMAIDTGDTAFILASMALVNLMTPGLAFFYGGLVRSSNVLTIMMQNYVSMGLVTIVWVVWGYSLCFGSSVGHGFIGAPADHYFLEGMGEWGTLPELVFAGYQGMFAVIAPSLMTGAFADRVRFVPYLIFIVVWVHLVYFPFAHWVWGGGWMARHGVKDFAGGIVVHTTAGFSALATVVALPNRKKIEGVEIDKSPHNIPFVALGTGLLWFGWFGFNGGSALAANGAAALAAMNSEISASTALFFWLLLEWKMEGKPTLVGACVGAIAGLATITPCAAYVKPWAALVIGILCVPWCYACIRLTRRYNLDDALDVWAVHGMGGLFGTLCVGIFSNKDMTAMLGAPGWEAGGHLFGIQLLAAVGCAVYSFVVGWALIKFIGLFVSVVPDEEDLKMGLDISMHGAKAYAGEDVSGSGSRREPKSRDFASKV